MEKLRLRLRVNGEEREALAPVHHTLLEVLREGMGLSGTKHGCELGECGTCTVLLDGRPVLSCVTLPVECRGPVAGEARGDAPPDRRSPGRQSLPLHGLPEDLRGGGARRRPDARREGARSRGGGRWLRTRLRPPST